MFDISHLPANQQELAHQVAPSHGHEDAPHSHALAEAGDDARLGQVATQLLQEAVEAALSCVAVDLV